MKRLLLAVALLLASGVALAAININTATKEELEALPGIGPVKAQAIVDYRNTNGPFKSPQDVMKVKGIKEGEFGKIKDQIMTSGTTTLPATPQRDAGKGAAAIPPAQRSAPPAAASATAASPPASAAAGAAPAAAASAAASSKTTAGAGAPGVSKGLSKATIERQNKAAAAREERIRTQNERAAKAHEEKAKAAAEQKDAAPGAAATKDQADAKDKPSRKSDKAKATESTDEKAKK